MSATLTQSQNRIVEIRLHGELAKRFGKVWHLAVSSPAEAVQALRYQCKGFLQTIRDLDRKGMVFRVRTRTHDYGDDDLDLKVGRNTRIDIVPIVVGASATVRFVAGVVLVAVGLFVGEPTLVKIGVALILGSVAEWLTPVPKKQATESKESWTMSGATNPSEQGGPVPVIYGEVITGGVPVSAGLNSSNVAPSGGMSPECGIYGNLYPQATFRDEMGVRTLRLIYSAGVFNLADPIDYSWTVGATTGVVAVRALNVSTATVTLEVDVDVQVEPVSSTVVLNLAVDGKTTDSNGEPKDAHVETSATVRITTKYWTSPGGH